MGRPGLMRHRKFIKLARLLESEALARGCLEMVWDAAYEAGDPLLGDADDVEALARWKGRRGKLAAAMVKAGFLDLDGDGGHRVHDLWHHAPDYVRKRAQREAERIANGETIRSLRQKAGHLGGLARAVNAQAQASGKQTASTTQARVFTPSPSPSPSPSRESASKEREGDGETSEAERALKSSTAAGRAP